MFSFIHAGKNTIMKFAITRHKTGQIPLSAGLSTEVGLGDLFYFFP
jgi:hypothetical protein